MNILWRSTAVLLATWLLTFLLRRASSSLRHSVWIMGFIAAALLPIAATGLPEWDIAILVPPSSPAPVASTYFATPIPAGSLTPPRVSALQTMVDWLKEHWLLVLWAVGCMIVSLRFLIALASVRRLRLQSHTLHTRDWQQIVDELRRRLSLRRPVRLVMGSRSFAPMTWGVVRPTVFLPSTAASWTEERRRLVLAHELAHVERWDGVLQIFIQAVSALYWFHPLVWLAAAQTRIERERACDDRVLNFGINAHDYADHLVEIARAVGANNTSLSPVTISMTHPSQLEKRVNSILDGGKSRSPISGRLTLAMLSLTAILTATLATAQLTARPAPRPLPAPAVHVPTIHEMLPVAVPPAPAAPQQTPAVKAAPELQNKPLQKWIDEDVAYIVTAEERQRFQSLQTDAEREHFIEQFWLRRDPTPGTAKNEFKEEFYQRIAYANTRFAYGNVSGWQTDRGHILIVHGKPDAIDSHPAGGTYERPASAGGGTTETYPFEIWTYNYVEGLGNNIAFEFVDPNQNGEYRLTVNRVVPVVKRDPVSNSVSVYFAPQSIPLEVSATFMPGAGMTAVSLTNQIPYRSLAFRAEMGFHTCEIHLAGRITDANGRVTNKFEDTANASVPDSDFAQRMNAVMTMSKTVYLYPGTYQLEITVQDTNAGTSGSFVKQLTVP